MMRRRPSTIDRMDPIVREEINRLRIDKGYTLDQIVDHLKTMDVAVSRAALGRHVKRLEDKVGAKIRELRVAAEAIRKTVDGADDGRASALNRELLHSILMQVATGTDEDGDPVEFTPQQTMMMAKALDHLAHAEKIDSDRLFRARQEAAKEAAQKTIDSVQAELGKNKQPGLSKQAIESIWREVVPQK